MSNGVTLLFPVRDLSANRILHDLADKTSGEKLRGRGPVNLAGKEARQKLD